MRDYCDNCGESFLTENLLTCQCGRSLCYRCMAPHQRLTGHSAPEDMGKYRLGMNERIRRDKVKYIDQRIAAMTIVQHVNTFACPQIIQTDVTFDLGGKLVTKRFELERPACERLLANQQLTPDQVSDYYLNALIAWINQQITR